MNIKLKNLKNLNLKQKMIFATILVLLVIFTILGGVMYFYVEKMMEDEGKNEANLIARDFASKMETELAVYFDIQKQFNYVFLNYEDINVHQRRSFYVKLAHDLLENNENLLAT
jgi:sensor histidine kinase regulating citrate/malate metabolism